MADEFKPITINTQEEMDNLFRSRLERESKKYEGYTSPDDLKKLKDSYEGQINALNTQMATDKAKYAAFDQQIAERDTKIAQYEADSEKTRIAIAAGLDPKYAARLMGKDKAEWEADAKALAKDFAAAHVPPLANPEGAPATNNKDAALKKMLQQMNGGQ